MTHPADVKHIAIRQRESTMPTALYQHECSKQYVQHLRENGVLHVDARTVQAGIAPQRHIPTVSPTAGHPILLALYREQLVRQVNLSVLVRAMQGDQEMG